MDENDFGVGWTPRGYTSGSSQESIQEKPPMQCGVCTTLKRQIRYGGQKGCMACLRHAGVYSQELRTQLQDTVDTEVAQSGNASSIDSPGHTAISLSSGPAPSSSSGTAPAAGRPAPVISNVVVVTVAESSTTQPTTRSAIRETDTGEQSRDERQRVLASRPDRTGVDVNACTCRTIVSAAGPEDRDGWTQQVVDRTKKCRGAKSGHLGHLLEKERPMTTRNSSSVFFSST